MVNQQVIAYIKTELAKGTTRELITSNLMAGGNWTQEEIGIHFNAVMGEGMGNPIPVKHTTQNVPTSVPHASKISGMYIILINIAVFIGYILLTQSGLLNTYLNNNGLLLYLGHSFFLLILATAAKASSLKNNTPSNAPAFGVSAIIILIIGFGTCAANISI